MECACGVASQPWRDRHTPWSPASFVLGLVLLAFGWWIIAFSAKPWVGWLVIALFVVAVISSWAVQGGRGHGGWCALRRALWFGIALPGAPVRLVLP